MNKRLLLAIGLLAGTIIGAGIFSLPYIFSRLGIMSGLLYLVFFTLVYFLIHLMYARVLELNPGRHQFFYLAHHYLPSFWGGLASFIILAELLLVLAVYLTLAPIFIQLVLPINSLNALLIFWLLGSAFIFMRLSLLGLAEAAGTIGILAIIFLIFFAGGNNVLAVPKFRPIDVGLFFLPFGPLLFSLAGRPAIHKVVEEHRVAALSRQGFSLGRAIFWGTAIPAMIYFLFVLAVLRLNPYVSPDTISSLGFLSPELLGILGVLGFITLWTSYFMIGANIKDILRIDLKWAPTPAALFVLVVPLGLYFGGLNNFLAVVSLTGSIFLALEAIFVIAMWRRAFPNNPWRNIVLVFCLVFLTAMAYEILAFLV
jgi:amino acid permease